MNGAPFGYLALWSAIVCLGWAPGFRAPFGEKLKVKEPNWWLAGRRQEWNSNALLLFCGSHAVHPKRQRLRHAACTHAERSGAVARPSGYGPRDAVQDASGSGGLLPAARPARPPHPPREGQPVQGEEDVYHPINSVCSSQTLQVYILCCHYVPLPGSLIKSNDCAVYYYISPICTVYCYNVYSLVFRNKGCPDFIPLAFPRDELNIDWI